LKLVDDFHVSHYASLTRKSSRFVGSITLRNLNQLKKKLVCWKQHEMLYLPIKFEKILRWWVDFSVVFAHLTWNDPQFKKIALGIGIGIQDLMSKICINILASCKHQQKMQHPKPKKFFCFKVQGFLSL